MLTKQVLLKMAQGVRELIPEYEESNKLRKEVIDYIKTIPSLVFTDKDREMMKKYPTYVRYEGKFDFSSPGYYNQKEKKDIPAEEHESSWIFRDYNYYTFIFPSNTELFFGNDISSLKVRYPKIYSDLLPKIKQLINTRNKYIKKFNKVIEVLQKDNITITLIKNNFPELYQKYKEL